MHGRRPEFGFDDVVRVAAANQIEVDGESAVESDGFQRVGGHRTSEVTADEVVLLALGFAFVDEVGAPGNIDDALSQCFVQRHSREAVAADADLVAECFAQGLAEHDGGVFDGVVDVDVVSPVAVMSRSIIECFDRAVSIWSKNGTLVEMFEVPVPSRLTDTDTVDSDVVREFWACLMGCLSSGRLMTGSESADAPGGRPVIRRGFRRWR